MKYTFISVMLITALMLFSSWGFFAHVKINELAVFTLPTGISRFYKANIQYISDHAVDPDKRRYADTAEAPRHYLDVELYEQNIDSIPRKWDDAVEKYGKEQLTKNGILPWQIQKSYYKLVNAFKSRDSLKILIYSAYLGHYIADAHVPLHTTQNHNGQLTNQVGIHTFWESRLPELFSQDYNYLVGKAKYIENPLTETWDVITHSLVDSVLVLEADLNNTFPGYRKYSFSERNNQVLKQYSLEYATAYHNMMNNMVEKQMKSAILTIGSFWYSAWVDAGQPLLEN
ncbi:zinc dependent phospholipase C family protein [Pedobacter foliorum]|uniref:zinc dependent phospholipase C family protein n=1 Tax=Pedobacter foliorum TaxID=2739058 RepID=UPI00156463B1|nr:zinc dependent phospholipase C family protein [Pedobacter foliorum]NRF40982.1 zinc dependent phospholipase C family protein [Pedobacter foliorum]